MHGLRGFAAATVMVYHCLELGLRDGYFGIDLGTGEKATTHTPYWFSGFTNFFMYLGTFAVCVFFCISGFLICQTIPKYPQVSQFFRNRVARIYPVFVTILIVTLIFQPFRDPHGEIALASHSASTFIPFVLINLFFIPGYFAFPIAVKAAWSLSYEALFYVIAGFTAFGTRQKPPVKGVLVGLGVLIALAAVIYSALALFFLVGVAAWYLQYKGWKYPSLGPLDVISLVGAYVAFQISAPLATVCLVPFFFAVAWQNGWLGHLLRTRVLYWLGSISYSLYLWHALVIDAVNKVGHRLLTKFGFAAGSLIVEATGIALALLVGYLSYELIEVRLTRKLFPSRKKPIEMVEAPLAAVKN